MNGDEIVVQAPGNEHDEYGHPQNAEEPWHGRDDGEEGPWQGRVEAEEVEYFEMYPDESNNFIIFE